MFSLNETYKQSPMQRQQIMRLFLLEEYMPPRSCISWLEITAKIMITPSIALIMGSLRDLNNQYPPTIKKSVVDNQVTLITSVSWKCFEMLSGIASTYSLALHEDVVVPF